MSKTATNFFKEPLIKDRFLRPEHFKSICEFSMNAEFRLADYDREDTNLRHLRKNLTIPEIQALKLDGLEARLRSLILAKSGRQPKIKAIYMNLNYPGEYQFSHYDGKGITALLYINPSWNFDWAGETQFYTDKKSTHSRLALPVPNRLVMFDGMILHRGGVPSFLAQDFRRTLVFRYVG